MLVSILLGTVESVSNQTTSNSNPEIVVGWGTLALIVAGIAQGKNRSGLSWFLGGLVFGPVALFFLLLCDNLPPAKTATK